MPSSVTVAVLGSRGVAAELGKKGTQSDITMFNQVRDGHAATLVEPTQYPEKFGALLTALAMADRAILVVPELSREIAETIATVDVFETPVELFLGPGAGEAEVGRAIKKTRLDVGPARPLELTKLRAEIDAWEVPDAGAGPLLVRIDHAFPVKGVGAVALGVVRRGTLQAHQRLRLFPGPKEVEVRSIQVHDVEVPSAAPGERVGVALRGIEADELARGQTLAPAGALEVATSFAGRLERPCPYYRGRIAPGAPFQLLVGLQLVPIRLTRASEGDLGWESDRPVAFAVGDPAWICDPSALPGPRIVGRVRLSGRAEG
ncbi:MAG TPA: EF-Tu/IF-2/RF-3 family GTPase [Thermoplasmata archaeon]|nr:EF-Tu/IF-2/RF-3 family GTPase [Thermoplasmata archaeon]